MTRVTPETHPNLCRVIDDMWLANDVATDASGYEVHWFEHLLPEMEQTCGELTLEEIETLVDGDEDDQYRLASRSVPLMAVHHVLAALFNT